MARLYKDRFRRSYWSSCCARRAERAGSATSASTSSGSRACLRYEISLRPPVMTTMPSGPTAP